MGYLLATVSNPCNPAYVTLEAPPSVTFDESCDFEEFIEVVHSEGKPRKLVSTELFLKRNVIEDCTIQGPAFSGTRIPGIESRPEDVVPCLVSSAWPTCALDFLHRDRPRDWPSKTMIERIEKAGCHVVGVGHPQSDNKDIEWRWSFSVAEKELIHDMNDGMYGCMYVLKAIKKHHWTRTDPDKPTTFYSYYIKTACLWVYETEPHNVNVMELCRKVLAWLIFWYRTNTLPHYFIPNQNLIGHLSKDLCKEVYDWLVYVQYEIRYLVCSCEIIPIACNIKGKLTRDEVDTVFSDPYILDNEHYNLEKDCEEHEILEIKECTPPNVSIDIRTELEVDKMLDCKEAIEKLFVNLHLGEAIYLPVIERISSILSRKGGRRYENNAHNAMFTTFLYRRLGDYYLHRCVDVSVDDKKLFIDKAVQYYTLGKEVVYPDGWSNKGLGGVILLARLYYLNDEWDMLDSVLTNFDDSVCTVVNGMNFVPFRVLTDDHLQEWANFRLSQNDRELFAVLKVTVTHHVPIYIHPLSFGYYMLCRSAHRQGDKAKMEWALVKLLLLSVVISFCNFARLDHFTGQLISIIQSLIRKM